MLFRQRFLDGIRSGEITLAFRRWRRPSVRTSGTLKTAIGVVRIGAVEIVREAALSDADARAAGYASRAELRDELSQRSEGDVYRIEVAYGGADPRIALREKGDLGSDEIATLVARLRRLDRASSEGPWTLAVLRLIERNEGVRAGNLAPHRGQEKERFKLDVRKLKNLGLTESLEVGYRLSPRGRALLKAIEKDRMRL